MMIGQGDCKWGIRERLSNSCGTSSGRLNFAEVTKCLYDTEVRLETTFFVDKRGGELSQWETLVFPTRSKL